MKNLNKMKLVSVLLLVVLMQFFFLSVPQVHAATTVNLGTGDNFAVIGASTVTNTGASVITGDLGLSPGTAITGFPPGTVNGTTHAADATALQAQNDITTASNSITGQQCDSDLTGQDLGGLTLTPGVYCFSSSAQLTGTLTLNGQGNSDAVFIFKISSALTTASESRVTFINSAQACNTFWQVGSSATLGTTTSFEGNILASESITLNTGATVNGRVLAQNGAVTLDNNIVSKTTCAAGTAGAPTSTPVPTSTSNSTSTTSSSTSGSVAAYCPPISNQVVTPVIIESKRIDADSIFLKWGPYSGTDTFNVQYGFKKEELFYNVNVTGFSTTINDLHQNQPIWVRVSARNECQIGTYGESKLIGGPRLPNTGFASQNNNFLYVLNQIKNWLLGH